MFSELRPRNCILAGASGTHTVCLSTFHQNTNLMFIGLKFATLTIDDSDVPVSSYQHYLPSIIYNSPLPRCFLGLFILSR